MERRIVHLLSTVGIPSTRTLLSEQASRRVKGDIRIHTRPQIMAEVKARGPGRNGFTRLRKWLGENGLLFLVEDHQEPLLVIPWRTLEGVLTGKIVLPAVTTIPVIGEGQLTLGNRRTVRAIDHEEDE